VIAGIGHCVSEKRAGTPWGEALDLGRMGDVPAMSEAIPSRASTRPVLVALVMLAAAAANLYQFADIDGQLPQHLRAIQEFSSFDIIELGLKNRNIRNTMNLYAVVGHEAPGIPLIITSPELNRRGSEFRARMLGIGLSSRIDPCKMDNAEVDLDSAAELKKGVVWDTPRAARRKGARTTWAFAKSAAKPTRLVQLKTPEVDVFIVDEALIAGGGKLCR